MRLREILPITEWLGSYSLTRLGPDGVAGLSLAAFVIPKSLAYASLAGLPPVSGLYCYLAAGLAYAVFGTSRQLAVGPTSALALAVAAGIAALDGGDPARAVAPGRRHRSHGRRDRHWRPIPRPGQPCLFLLRFGRHGLQDGRGPLHRLHAAAQAPGPRRQRRQFLRAPCSMSATLLPDASLPSVADRRAGDCAFPAAGARLARTADHA